MTSYHKGYNACLSGAPLSDNPYAAFLDESHETFTNLLEWKQGWLDARHDIQVASEFKHSEF